MITAPPKRRVDTKPLESITESEVDDGASNEIGHCEWFYNVGHHAIDKDDDAPTDEERAWSDYSRRNLHGWANENPF